MASEVMSFVDFWRGGPTRGFVEDFAPFAFSVARASFGMDTLPEWSKGVDSSSTSASCVGSNPTGVISRRTFQRGV